MSTWSVDETGPVGYDSTIYSGCAAHYRVGRPPYSADLESTLVAALELDGTGRLLDAGCGPGVIALRLAGQFNDVVGLDPDADMLVEASRHAATQGVNNISWVCAVAEALPDAAPGPYRLVTFGQSFHWMDEDRVAEVVYDMLEPGGAMAMVVHTVEGRQQPASPGPPPIPHDEVRSLVAKYLGSTGRAGQGVAPVRTHRFEDVLVRTRFGSPSTVFAPGRRDLVRDIEGVLSGYLSMSYSAPHLFGSRIDEFADEVRALLRGGSPSGFFWDWPGDTEIVLARRPGRTAG